MKEETATFGAGCFWGVEAKFMRTPGVKDTSVGYMGGSTQSPTYEDVCDGTTGHAEVVQLKYAPTEISFDQLLDVFFKLHDPTTLDRQGPDVGSQYRSVVFYHTPDQKSLTIKKIDELNRLGTFGNAIVTKVAPAGEYWSAEDYHQKYLMKRGQNDCRI